MQNKYLRYECKCGKVYALEIKSPPPVKKIGADGKARFWFRKCTNPKCKRLFPTQEKRNKFAEMQGLVK